MNEHLTAEEVALHLDGALSPTEQARLDAHLAECDACRAELIAVSRVLRAKPDRRRWYIPAAAAAAAIVLLLIWPRPWAERLPPNYREPAVSTTPAPIGLVPRGPTEVTPLRLIWTRVPHAERYRLTVFDSTGSVIWESQTTDTSLAVPRTVRLRPRIRYFWQVEAQTSWNRWIKSDMVEFSRP